MAVQTPEWPDAGKVAEQLIAMRRRGLHRIDQRPRIDTPETEQLAQDYCQAKGLSLHGRVAQITRLLQDGLEAYGGQGNEYDRQLISRLFFDPLVTASTKGPSDVLEKLLSESGKDESDFRAERHERFGNFAEFLVAFVNSAVRRSAKRPPFVWIAAVIAVLVVIGGTLATVFVIGHRDNGSASTPPTAGTSPHSSSPPYVAGKTYTEQVGQFGAPTFTDPHSPAVTGVRVPAYQKVEVSCKVLAPTIPSVSPDGYWYRIASPQWNDKYYAVANTFQNGDTIGGPSEHNTDFSVPDCPSQ